MTGTNVVSIWRSQSSRAFMTTVNSPNVIHRRGVVISIMTGFIRELIIPKRIASER